MTALRSLLASALLALAAASPLSAQLIGVRVLDRATGQPVPEVTVEALRANDRSAARARTDAQGYAVLQLPEPLEVRLRASRVGYQTATSSAFNVELRQALETEMRIASGEVVLEPLTVTARSTPPRSPVLEREEFYQRERSSQGKFLTRYEIQNMVVPTGATEIFSAIPGIRLQQTGGRGRVVTISRGGRNCVPQLLIDEAPMPIGDLDRFIQPAQIAGVEIYRSDTEIPIRWAAYRKGCGLIVVWTEVAARR